jgi:hypothetical protein
VRLVSFIIRKFVAMRGYMNVLFLSDFNETLNCLDVL